MDNEKKEATCIYEYMGFTKGKNYTLSTASDGFYYMLNNDGYENGFSINVFDHYFTWVTNPAPLSEQKQEGETHKDVCIRAIKATYPTISNLDKFAERYFVTHMVHSHVDQKLTSMIIEQSQHTAKQIEELRTDLYRTQTLYVDETERLNKSVDEKDKQIDQYKARIWELEALLKNSRNAIAELNEEEWQFGIQLCNDIDAALEAEILTLKNK